MRAARAAVLPLLLLLAVAPARRAAGEDPPGTPAAPLPAPRIVGPRLPGRERDEALRRLGGSAETEKAVEAGLDWLERHAREGGGWDGDGFPGRCAKGTPCDGVGRGHHGEDAPCPFDQALSGFAALAFLGHGVLPDADGDARARLLDATLRGLSGGDAWADALATEAFAEAEALERRGRWRARAEAGAASLLAARGADGGFGYIAGMRKGSDTPFTAFAVTALLAARDAGARLPADLGPGVDRFLATLEEKSGKLAYLLDGRSYGYTPTAYNAHAAFAVRELLGTGTAGARHRAHLALVQEERPAWVVTVREVAMAGQPARRVRMGRFDLLHWYYGTLGMFRRGSSDWSGWYGAAKSALIPHQRKDGCARGSWDPVGFYEMNVGGRVLATALGVLVLEQPVRQRAP